MPTCGNYGKCEEPRLLPGLAGCPWPGRRRGRPGPATGAPAPPS